MVPNYTALGYDGAGTTESHTFYGVPSKGSQLLTITFKVLDGSSAPPDGSIIDLVVNDEDTGASISSLILAQTPPTRLLSLGGNLAFGGVPIGTSISLPLTITNSGNSPLTISSINYPSSFSGDFNGGVIAAGATVVDHVTFAPATATAYAGTITLGSDVTGGAATITVTGTGTASSTTSPPVVVGNVTVTGQIGAAFAYQIVASHTPTHYDASNLPSGLIVDHRTGVISGLPTQAGNYLVTLSATNAGGTGTATLTIVVNSLAPTVTVTTAGDGFAVEGGETGKVVVHRTGDLSAALTVRYKVAGSARAGVDYKSTTGSITILAGVAQAKIKIKPIAPRRRCRATAGPTRRCSPP